MARTSVDLAIAGLAVMSAGLVLREAAVVGWGGALLVGLAIARAVTVVDVAKIRAAGFEMTWRGEARRVRLARGERVELEAELRNRDARAASFSGARWKSFARRSLHHLATGYPSATGSPAPLKSFATGWPPAATRTSARRNTTWYQAFWGVLQGDCRGGART